ncbi:MAG TPA: hypothetical protein VLF60_04550 [Candidatus Saccharimonadales bacterium]|nr:hypothetical protein [Candidatus Saccharimonadales bacterium]
MKYLKKLPIKSVSQKGRFVLAVVIGAVVGGASTAIVQAAIPSSNGTISGCYSKVTGALKVKDTEAGQTCTGLENSISWPSQGGGSQQAISYVRLNADGTLDTSYSRGVQTADLVPIPNSDPIVYNLCLKMSTTPKAALKNGTHYGGLPLAAGDPNQASEIQDSCGSGYNAELASLSPPYETQIGIYFN